MMQECHWGLVALLDGVLTVLATVWLMAVIRE